MKQIKFNGLLWDAENLEIGGKAHLTFDEAQKAAQLVGKRLPTVEEFRKLAQQWTCWDDENKIRRFKNDNGDELLFPAAGETNFCPEPILDASPRGGYWSISLKDHEKGYFSAFDWIHLYSIVSTHRLTGFSVRCVQDI